ncbi:MAG: hypothetical protein IPK70_13475 [Flavobacteriales bacterium]|jgi:hypothetical protein|nr:hypothetical protein [Flavobacteriales bacterium]
MALAILTALAVVALRLVLHAIDAAPQGTDFMLVHFLAIVTVVFFNQLRFMRKAKEDAGFPHLVREGFKGAAIYALIMLLFLWWYYHAVETDAFERRVEQLVFSAVEEGQEELRVRPMIMRFFTPFNYASMSFFALLAAGIANALIIGAIHHKILRRTMR